MRERRADTPLVSVVLRRIDVPVAGLESPFDRLLGFGPILDLPHAEAEHRHRHAAPEVAGRLRNVGDHGRSVPRIVAPVSGLFVPGWGAHPGIYRGAVPAGWAIPDPPTFVASGATVAAYRRWIVERCRSRRGPFTLAGHSFGAVLAVHAALAGGVEVEIERLVLVSPSALPLEKPVPLMFWDFSRRVAAGWLPPRDAARAARQVVFHPLLARRLGMEVRAIDLSLRSSAGTASSSTVAS